MILKNIIENTDIVLGRAVHGLNLLLQSYEKFYSKSLKCYINPNICFDVLLLLKKFTEPVYLDHDFVTGYMYSEIFDFLDHEPDVVHILIYNCIYGDSEVDFTNLKIIKQKYPQVIIICDACLVSLDNYISLKNKEIFDAILYSFGYSKFIDINYGGTLTINDETVRETAKSLVEPSPKDFIDECYWDNYLLNSRRSLPVFSIVYHKIENIDTFKINKKIEIKNRLVKSQRWRIRDRIRDLMYEYEPFLLEPDRFDWRLNYVISGELTKANVELKLANQGLLFSRHYQPEQLYKTPKTNAILKDVYNILDDYRQIDI